MDTLLPRLPSWARGAALWPHPEEGESFEAYCRRIGLAQPEIDRILEGLSGRTLENANARLADLLLRKAKVHHLRVYRRLLDPRRAV